MKGSALLLVATLISCTSPATSAPTAVPVTPDIGTPSPAPSITLPGGAPSFRQILTSGKSAAYTVSYKFTATKDQDIVEGTYACMKKSREAVCSPVAVPEAATVQEALLGTPEKFEGVLVETRQLLDQQAHCYDVRALDAAIPMSDGRFCYTREGVPLFERFTMPDVAYVFEAVSFSIAGTP